MDDFRYSKHTLRAQKSPEDEYELDPALEVDPLDIKCLAQPGPDYVGMSIVGTVKIVQMFRMVGAPLAEPYSGAGPPGEIRFIQKTIHCRATDILLTNMTTFKKAKKKNCAQGTILKLNKGQDFITGFEIKNVTFKIVFSGLSDAVL